MVKSQFADRDTVGTIYSDLQKNGPKDKILIGDMSNEIMSSFVSDLNDTIVSNPHDGRPFYIMVHEKKDLMMPSMMHRNIHTSVYRPWPECDTTVFWTDPSSNTTLFCWCIPHWSEMDNILANEDLYHEDIVATCKAWKNLEMHYFGFHKDDIGNWIPNPNYKDKPLVKKQPLILPTSFIV